MPVVTVVAGVLTWMAGKIRIGLKSTGRHVEDNFGISKTSQYAVIMLPWYMMDQRFGGGDLTSRRCRSTCQGGGPLNLPNYLPTTALRLFMSR
jgi:hypothetical protein